MNCNIELTPNFKKEAKRLKKKYPSLNSDLEILIDELSENPQMGTPLGNGVYKVRMAIASKGQGKSGGARIISYAKLSDELVLLLSIYDKSEKENLSDKDIQKLLKDNT
ncbi:MAG: type II toxin-antitoxin system RelE/ParE family toxin [Prevotellaceae bacterium]|jgi:mRNA-degrading endonuclease RelE of RelBE toxin-antitoxin system|nr:type II toxin-antitoxin system RelE/ParE family toxin [Prevotellaceae bacterium]